MKAIQRNSMQIIRAVSQRPACATFSSSAPSVEDITVQVNFMTEEGNRTTVPGLEGMSIHEVATMHNIDIGHQLCGSAVNKIHSDTWTEDLFGEGPQLGFDHIMISPADQAKIPPRLPTELELLRGVWDEDEISDNSRLSCMVVLSKDMDGMTVYVPDRVPDDGH